MYENINKGYKSIEYYSAQKITDDYRQYFW